MRALKGILAWLLVIAIVIISFALPLSSLASTWPDASGKTAGRNDASTAFASGLQEPPGDYIIRLSSLWFVQSNLSFWRLIGMLLVSYIAISLLIQLYFASYPEKKEVKSIFLASWHILRAPPMAV